MNYQGKGGKSLNDRELAARVRTLALKEIERALKNKKNKRLYEAILIRLAGSVLPRLNEHTGADGDELFPAPLLGGKSNDNLNGNTSTHTSAKKTAETEEKN